MQGENKCKGHEHIFKEERILYFDCGAGCKTVTTIKISQTVYLKLINLYINNTLMKKEK